MREQKQIPIWTVLAGLGRDAKVLRAEARHHPRLLGLLAPLRETSTPDKEVRA